MNKQDLPETLYIPSFQLAGRGSVDAQFGDDENNIHIPVWSDESQAVKWLREGGVVLWANHDTSFQGKIASARASGGGGVVVRKVTKADYLVILSVIGEPPKRYLDFEPEVGSLFAPPDRRVSVK